MSDFPSRLPYRLCEPCFRLDPVKMDQVGTIRELAMTTKELCDALRHTHPSRTMCKEAADLIERLAEELQYQYASDKAQQQEIERLSALARDQRVALTPTCPDQNGCNSNARDSNVASAKASPSYQHAPICKCRSLD